LAKPGPADSDCEEDAHENNALPALGHRRRLA
jgi:hypothetical protein